MPIQIIREDITKLRCDAIGDAIRHISNIHKYARKEDVPVSTLFVITTDGMENASHRYDHDEVKAMIERQKEEYGWEFLFIGANIDAAKTAANIGISRDRAANYHADSKGTEILYVTVSEAISDVCASRAIQAEWAAPIHKDYQERK